MLPVKCYNRLVIHGFHHESVDPGRDCLVLAA